MYPFQLRNIVAIVMFCWVGRAWITQLTASIGGPWLPFLNILLFDLALITISIFALPLNRAAIEAVRGQTLQRSHVSWGVILGIAYFGLELGLQGSFAYLSTSIAPGEVEFRWPFWAPVRIGNYSTGPIIFAFLVACIATPIAEEFVFRGLMLGFSMSTRKFVRTTIVTSLAFSLMHFKKPELLSIFCFSIGMAFLYRRSGSLWPCVISHSIANTLAFVQHHYVPHWFERSRLNAGRVDSWSVEWFLLLLSLLSIGLWIKFGDRQIEKNA